MYIYYIILTDPTSIVNASKLATIKSKSYISKYKRLSLQTSKMGYWYYSLFRHNRLLSYSDAQANSDTVEPA